MDLDLAFLALPVRRLSCATLLCVPVAITNRCEERLHFQTGPCMTKGSQFINHRYTESSWCITTNRRWQREKNVPMVFCLVQSQFVAGSSDCMIVYTISNQVMKLVCFIFAVTSQLCCICSTPAGMLLNNYWFMLLLFILYSQIKSKSSQKSSRQNSTKSSLRCYMIFIYCRDKGPLSRAG